MKYLNQFFEIGKKLIDIDEGSSDLVSKIAEDFDGDFSDQEKFQIRAIRTIIRRIDYAFQQIDH